MEEKVRKEDIIEALKTVYDPDMGLDIYFLGLIYDIKINGSDVYILMTFTSPMCPMASFIQGEVKEKVSQVEGVKNVEIEVTFEPQWQPSDELKSWLGF